MKSYKDTINEICKNIHTEVIDFDEPRSEASMPTQASSQFITHKQQGDWAEDVIVRAINNNSDKIVAVRYGKSDDLVAGEEGFEQFFNDYQKELDQIGKRPDILLFKKEDYNPALGLDISSKDRDQTMSYVKKAVAGIEIRSSAFLVKKYVDETNKTLENIISRVIAIRDLILCEYIDLLEQKRPELIPILQQIDKVSVKSIDFRKPTWRSSQRLQELSALLAEIKECLKIINKRMSLSITPKVEDLKVVHKWINTYNVPHFYVQVFFDKVYGISFRQILELVSNAQWKNERYFIERDSKNQNKTTIKIPVEEGICLAETVTEPDHHSVRKELNKGRLLYCVKFDGGGASLDLNNFETLFGIRL